MEIDHVAVAVRDIDAALPYYVETLGLTPIHDEVLTAAGVRLVYLAGGAALLQLVQPVARGPVAEYLAAHGEGLHHLCFAVDDIPATLRELPGQTHVPVVMGGRGRRACFLAAPPNGLRIELTERVPFDERGAEAAP